MSTTLSDIKHSIIEEMERHLKHAVLESEDHLNNLIEARNSETKSTAGDKHETARAMVQSEIDRVQLQHSRLIQQQHDFSRIEFEVANDKVRLGSLVVTELGTFLLSIGFGKVELSEDSCFAISIDSPMAQLLLNKSAGDSVQFKDKALNIQEIV